MAWNSTIVGVSAGAFAVALFVTAGLAFRRGTVQKQVEIAVANSGGHVSYDCDIPVSTQQGTFENRLGRIIGPQFVGSICDVELFLCNDSHAVADLLTRFPSLESLEGLALDGAALDDACIQRVGQVRSLTFLSVGATESVDLSPLKDLPHLKTLVLRSSKGITPRTLRALAKIPRLEELDLAFTDVAGESLGELCNFMQLRRLWLSCTDVSAKDLVVLNAAPHLEEVFVGPSVDGGEEEFDRVQRQMPHVRLKLD